MPVGMLLGIAFGTVFYGAMFGDVAIGMGIGISLGLCFGSGIGASKDAKINKQLEEFGYKVKSLTETENGFTVTAEDKNGGERRAQISAQIQKKENLKPGDYVYFDGNSVEQAY